MWGKALRSLCILGLAMPAFATPPNTPYLDGRPAEYDAGDPQAAYTGGGGGFGAGNYLTNLYVTWDATYLYIALQGGEVDNKLVVMLDVDPDAGTGATTTTNWSGVLPTYIEYNDVGWRKSDAGGAVAFGLDYQVASEGFYNNIVQVLYDGVATPDSNTVIALFDSGNGSGALGTPVDMAVQSDTTSCGIKGFEARIPWSVLYPTNGVAADRFGAVNTGETVPLGARLRLFAAIHNNVPDSSYSSNDAIPEQVSPNASWAAGLLVTDTYLDVLVDGNNDGLPDVSVGDVNAPFIRFASGVQGKRTVFVQLNEPLNATTATETNNWRVGADIPATASMAGTNVVVLGLTNDLPASGTIVLITATNVQDTTGNERLVEYCLNPAASGLTNALTVRFVLETASGLGVSPGASNFFVNGGYFPLEFGYPPATSSPLTQLSGTLYYRDVVFPPGTAQGLSYKYSGQLNATGTNTYEAVRLTEYADAARQLTLPTNSSFLVVTDYLGAAAGPYRDPGTNVNYNALFADPQRGDAGVRERTTVLFQLDLSGRNRAGITRVLIQGSDPLRGFNANDQAIPGDYAGTLSPPWTIGGVTLVDDGTLGDLVADDGIYSREWVFSTNGYDSVAEPGYPYNLVGGEEFTDPYFGDSFWVARRSPRSVVYKFYILKSDTSVLESPSSNIELYLQDTTVTNMVLNPFVWENDQLPLPPPTNSPTMIAPVILTGNQVRVLFNNLTNELQHGVQVSTNLGQDWMDFGGRASGSSGNWTLLVQNANPTYEFYRAFAGPPQTNIGVYFEPNPLPSTGGVLRVWYRQHNRSLAGARNVGLTGPWNGWGNGQAMTFAGNGAWYYDLAVSEAASTDVIFKARTTSGDWDGGPDVHAYKGTSRASWSPPSPTNGDIFTVTYDAAGGPLAAATNIYAHLGFDEPWYGVGDFPMTNSGGTIWTISVTVPSNIVLSVNFVFNNGAGTWDSEGNPGTGGRQYRAFLSPYPYP